MIRYCLAVPLALPSLCPVHAFVDEDGLHVSRYRDVRGGEPSMQPVPALGWPALLLAALGSLWLARRRFANA